MSLWDIPVILYVIAVGVINYRSDEVEGWGEWAVRTLLLSLLIAGPYFFWDEIGAYWASSSEGPVEIEAGWW